MYSPKIKQEFIPVLYHLANAVHKPMTVLVNGIIEDYLTNRQADELMKMKDDLQVDNFGSSFSTVCASGSRERS